MRAARFFAIAAAAVMIVAAPVSAYAADSQPTIRTGDYRVPTHGVIQGDLIVRDGTAIVPSSARINGDLIVQNGSVRVFGTVSGDVRKYGTGGVLIGTDGTVFGSVADAGDGNVSISGRVMGHVAEKLAGDVIVRGYAGSVTESHDRSGAFSGRIRIYGEVPGAVKDFDAGGVILERSAEVGSVVEYGAGSILVRGLVEGNVRETSDGDVLVYEYGAVLGNVVESEAGNVVIYDGAQIDGKSVEKGWGSIIMR
ncbi:hypothetical protein ACFQRL_02800 [Microbacterium fluvii]|uniref:Polymer-forming cytoskeletal protein n=1 Tax=Microbacterium fluvii TaxID=415215 RepID=A0ABW2H968_9MICO|nr:hypothetical protein [Microbacterium fluvii]MCU4671522.1 hypothetical protein [Microbacterium fluvii]